MADSEKKNEQVPATVATESKKAASKARAKKKAEAEPSRAVLHRTVTLGSDQAQRVMHRTIERLGVDTNSISVISRIVGNDEQAKAAEDHLTEVFKQLHTDLDNELERSQVLMNTNGISEMCAFSGEKSVSVEIVTPWVGQFLNIVVKMDQLMAHIETLYLTSVIEPKQRTERTYMWQRRLIKTASRVRQLADGLRSLAKKKDGSGDTIEEAVEEATAVEAP